MWLWRLLKLRMDTLRAREMVDEADTCWGGDHVWANVVRCCGLNVVRCLREVGGSG